MRLQERFLSGVRNDTDQRKIVIRCDKKDDKKDDQDRQWYGECLPYEQCRLLCEGYSQSRDHSRIEEDHL